MTISFHVYQIAVELIPIQIGPKWSSQNPSPACGSGDVRPADVRPAASVCGKSALHALRTTVCSRGQKNIN